jgi:hypothetical protein
MGIYEVFVQFSLIGVALLLMASTFWAEKPKLAPANGMQVLNDTHALVATGNCQINNRLGKLEDSVIRLEKKMDKLIQCGLR